MTSFVSLLLYSALGLDIAHDLIRRSPGIGKAAVFDRALQWADALLAEELGFGMWRGREDIVNVEDYVSDLREAEMRTPDCREKTPQESLREINS